MSRVSKPPQERRQEIIQVAHLLFKEKGYAHTSVELIIQTANIAKGTFYYYFKSKQEVLSAVVHDIFLTIYHFVKRIAQAPDLTTLEKINEIFIGAQKRELTDPQVMDVIHQVENRELQERLNIQYVEHVIPLITDIFNQGVDEQLWTQRISVQTAQIILGGTQFILDSGLFDWTSSQRHTFLGEIKKMIDRLLEAQPHILDPIFSQLQDNVS